MTKEISLEEIARLDKVKESYIRTRLSGNNNLIIIVVGFCLATLSSENVSDQLNALFAVLSLVGFMFILLKQKRKKDNPLSYTLIVMRERYRDCQKTQELLNSYDIWKGLDEEKRYIWMPVAIAVIFCVYALYEHLARAGIIEKALNILQAL